MPVISAHSLVHFTNEAPKPRSITHTVYDIAEELDRYRIHISYIDALFLREDMKRLLPLTVFYAPNEAFEGKVFQITEISETLLENHIFKELLWCEKLVGMAGQRVESHNGQTWLVSVNEKTGMPCFDTIEVFGGAAEKACITVCDILARNGIVHELDTVLVYEVAETRPPSPPIAPIAPVYQQPSTPLFPRPTPVGPPTQAPGQSSSPVLSLAWAAAVVPVVLCLLL